MRPLRMSLFLCAFVVLFSLVLFAQVPYEYTTNPNAPITDFTTTSSSITITDAFTITDLNVMVDIAHPFAQDLTITITKAGGPTVTLSANNGGGFADYMTTIFDDQAAGYVNGGAINAPNPCGQFNGIYIPQQALVIFNGSAGAGTWTLSVTDGALVHQGTFKKWGLIFNRVGSFVQPYKDFRVGWDLNNDGASRYFGFGGLLIDAANTIPPYSVQGTRPEGGITSGIIALQNSAISSMTKITAKQTNPFGNVLYNNEFDFPLTTNRYGFFGPVYLNGIGMHRYLVSGFQRYGLFMNRGDDQLTMPVKVTAGSIGYDNGIMQSFFNYITPECDVITANIYQPQYLTSIDIYQGFGVELVTPGTGLVDVNVWNTAGGMPNAVLYTSQIHAIPPQGDKWVTYYFRDPLNMNMPPLLPPGNYGFGMCVIADPLVGGVALGLDQVTSYDPMFGRYEGLFNQWYNWGGWFEEIGGFLTNKMIRANFITGVDVGVYTIDSPIGTSGGPQNVTVTFKSYNHQPQLPNLVATGRVTIRTTGGGSVYTSERRVTLTPWSTSQVNFDLFTAPAAGTYTVTAEILRINNADDENLVNNSYTRTFTLLFPIAPVIISEDGSLTEDQKTELTKNFSSKSLEVVFQNRKVDGDPLKNGSNVVWVGDVNSIDDQAVRSFVENGNYFAVVSPKQIADIGNQLIEKLTPASEISYRNAFTNKMNEARIASEMKMRNMTGAKPAGDNNVKPLTVDDGIATDNLADRLVNFTTDISNAKTNVDQQGPPPPIDPRRSRVVTPNGSIKVRESLFGSMILAEVFTNKEFTQPSVESKPMPTEFVLDQNYPNPFNPSTNIAYTLSSESYITLRIYDVLGREIATLFNGVQNQGRYLMMWDGESTYGSQTASGVYFYRLEASPTNGSTPFAATKKMVLAR